MVVVHAPAPEQAPDQPANVEPVLGVAVRVTLMPDAMRALHVAPQSIPEVEETTDPVPVPDFITVSVFCGEGRINVAETLLAWVMATVQVVPVPEHAPPQLVKVEPADGTAERTTSIPALNTSEQMEPQLRRFDAEDTVPVPPPFLVTVIV